MSDSRAFAPRASALLNFHQRIAEVHKVHAVQQQPCGPFDILEAQRPLTTEQIMSDLDRLHDIIDALPPQQIHALLTLLDTRQPISDEEFARRLAEVPEEEVDEETIARILAAEAEQGESISHGELKQRLGL